MSLDERGARRLHIYGFGEGTWVPTLEAALGPEVSFVDVANIDGRDRLITYEPGRLNWFDPESGTERVLVVVTSNSPPARGEIPHVDVTRDVNGDRRSALLVERSRKELHVFLGVPGAELFAQRPQKVAVAMPKEEYTWLVDLNRDGKQDILMHHPLTTEPQRLTILISRERSERGGLSNRHEPSGTPPIP